VTGKSKIENRKSKIVWFTFTLIILIAFFFRFYRLADYPLGIFFDPAITGLDAIRLMQRGGPVIFFPTNGGREAFFMYLLIPFIWLFDTTPFSMRALTSTISLFNVIFLFAFLYRIPIKLSGFTHSTSQTITNYRFWLATLGTLALATSYWHIAISRLGQRPILVPMLAVPLFWFFFKGWVTGQKRWFVFSGLLMGLEGYTYSAARLLPVILILVLLPEFVPKLRNTKFNEGASVKVPPGKGFKDVITNLFIFGLVAIIIYTPMAFYLVSHPGQFSERAFSVMVWHFLDTPPDIMAEIGRNSLRVAGFFCCNGSPNPLFGLPNFPGSHPLLLPFLLMGLVGALKHWQYLFPRLVALWWLLGLIPSLLAIEAPHPLRMIVAVVPTAILIGLGPIYLVQWLKTKRPNLIPDWLLLLAVPIILAPVIGTTTAYFSDWTKLQSTRGAYDYGAIAIRDTILEHSDADTPIYLPLARFNAPTLLYYLSGQFSRQAALSSPLSDSALVISPEKNINDTTWVRLHHNTATILPPLTTEGQQLLQTALTNDSAEPIRVIDGEVIARLASLSTDPARYVEQPTSSLDASFGPVRLTGATYPAIIEPSGQIPITLFWQANTQMTSEYEVLVRLVDDNGRAWGNGDARPTDWVYPTSFWRPGLDEISAQHIITIKGDSPVPGRYWLAVSIFDPALNKRLPLTAGVSVSPDTFFIGPLKVPLPEPRTPEQTSLRPPISFGEIVQLTGFTIDQPTISPGQPIQLSLYWRVIATPKLDYTIFVHLLDENNNLVTGNDTQPVNGQYPTTIWTPSERILDTHTLSTPENLTPGQYRLAIGLYHQPTSKRLLLHLPNGQIDTQGRLILKQSIAIIGN